METEKLIRKTWDRLKVRPRPLSVKESVAFLNIAGVQVTLRQLRHWIRVGRVRPEHVVGEGRGRMYLLGKRSLEMAAYVASGEGVECQQ